MTGAATTSPARRTLATHQADSTQQHSSSSSSSSAFPLPDFTLQQSPSSHAVFTKQIETPLQDKRQYKLIQLPNALQVLLIHDPDTEKGSAAMDIKVGHLSDPKELQGLAHYLEHMLFLGTEKYPRENDYHSFLSNHSGHSNAYTGMDNTCYYLDVGADHLEPALDRFAQFFLKPLFNDSCAEREVRAVDSEHKKNLQDDMWRGFQLEKSLSDPAHPYSNFGTGSLSTLWDTPRSQGIDVRSELLKFHERHYSANVMKLVVLGREPLDQLTDWVIQKFSGVPNRAVEPPSFPHSPLKEQQLGTQVFYQTIKDHRSLQLTFPIPDQAPFFKSKPAHIVSHFIGHEGKGSVLSYLKAQGWANSVGCYAGSGADGFAFFKVQIDMTTDGLKHYEDIVRALFRYINLLKQKGVEEWAYDEVAQLQNLSFKFAEKTSPSAYTSDLASQLQEPYPREWVISGGSLLREFAVQEIRQIVDSLRPSNCRIFVAAKTIPPSSASSAERREYHAKEKWYGTPYLKEPIPESITRVETEPNAYSSSSANGTASHAAVAPATDDFALPTPNSFIPQSLDVPQKIIDIASAPTYKPAIRPLLIRDTPKSRLWYKRDDRFFLPKATALFMFKNPIIDATPANAVRSRLLTKLLKDALTEYSYDSLLAGLSYNIEASGDMIGLNMDGYNDKLPVLFSTILSKLASFANDVDPKRFELIKEKTRRAYENYALEAPYKHAMYYSSHLLQERAWTMEEKLAELEKIQLDDFKRYIPEVLARSHFEMLVDGNMDKAEAEKLLDTAEEILGGGNLSESELIGRRSLLLPPGSNVNWVKDVGSPGEVNSAVQMYMQIGSSSTEDASASVGTLAATAAASPSDVRTRATLSLLAQIATEPAFDTLRTKEQLGYIVFAGASRSPGSLGFRVIVQSERPPAYLEERIDAFLGTTLREILDKMTPEEFDRHRDSVIQELKEKPKNMWQEASRFWTSIHSGYFDFLARKRNTEALQQLTLADVRALFDAYIDPASPKRAKLSIHLKSQAKVVRFSERAAEALKQAIQNSVDAEPVEIPKGPNGEDPWELLNAQKPGVDVVKSFVSETLSGLPEEKVKGLLSRIDSLAAEFPHQEASESTSSAEAQSGQGAEGPISPKTITEAETRSFQATLVPSQAPTPVVPLAELARPDENTGGLMGEEADADKAGKANL
ncbi:metalloprotease [Tilletia horrida]|uniref:Metalloprotease n=1 Tax=Tilletia horrida TaxID=155126 RepID=A0AAN6K017_9BASI|nr:metalloprotease [Tilletia horrida]KAK0569452.1 metalloprotease [Tilletia horrida]